MAPGYNNCPSYCYLKNKSNSFLLFAYPYPLLCVLALKSIASKNTLTEIQLNYQSKYDILYNVTSV